MPDDLQELDALEQLAELRGAYDGLERRLRRAKARSEDLVQASFDGARDAMRAHGPVKAPAAPKKDQRAKKAEVALWHLTDWQLAKVTSSYDSDVCAKRIGVFCERAERLTDIQRADHPVREAVILFGGDIGEGLFNFPQQPFQIDSTIFTQFTKGARLCADVVLRALALYDRVTVVSEWGNHGRIGNRRASVPSADNFDRMIYQLARDMLPDKRLTWLDSEEDIQHVEVGNYRALLIHGDEIGRNGYASRNTLVQGVNRWRSGAHRWEFRDVYLGHYHQHAEEPLANGEGAVFFTGSPESDNRYAADRLASSALPSQRLHFVDPHAGRITAQYKVHLT